MIILHISDTHGKHHQLQDLPVADVIVHSGDFTWAGTEDEAYNFMNWFCDLPYKHKIFIAGNHDDCLYAAHEIEGLPNNVHYLCNSGITIQKIKFYGIPMFMSDCIDGSYNSYCEKIPTDTDVLITHQPPSHIYSLTDNSSDSVHFGDPMIAKKVNEIKPACHLFGHVHDAYAIVRFNGTIFSNASVLDNEYLLINSPRLIEI